MKIHAIGGYDEVGKNMTALEVGEDVILFDSGLFLPAIVGVAEREKIPTERGMRSLGALPDDLYLEKHNLQDKVRAILVSHAHLDHVGSLPYNAYRYDADILGTPFTMEFFKLMMKDANQSVPNRILKVSPNASHTIIGKQKNKVEFINITHSTIQSTLIAVHTPEGVVLYANDYKLDNSPVFGEKTNYARLKELAKTGVKALVVDCLYAPDDRKTPSEKIAQSLLEDVLMHTTNDKSGIVVSTFSSHIARLKTIAELGKKLGREVIFVGRSLNKYVTAANNVGQAPFMKNIKIATYRKQLEKILGKANENRSKYIIVCTGHQGEPGSILDRMSRGSLPFRLAKDDLVIFSSRTIPAPVNELNRSELQKRLAKYHVRIFDNIHVSGHGGKEDLRELITLTKPQHIIPSHGDLFKRSAGAFVAEEMGYKKGETVHLLDNGHSVEI